MPVEEQVQLEFKMGEYVTLDEKRYLVVRYCDSVTLFEEPTTGEVFVEHEQYVEMRDEEGEVRFHQIARTRNPGKRAPGKIRGIKPYFWKG